MRKAAIKLPVLVEVSMRPEQEKMKRSSSMEEKLKRTAVVMALALVVVWVVREDTLKSMVDMSRQLALTVVPELDRDMVRELRKILVTI